MHQEKLIRNLLKEFIEVASNPGSYIINWKNKNPGKKVIGYFDPDIPLEMLVAASCLPVRMISGDETSSKIDQYLPVFMCSRTRSCFGHGICGGYDYLDGVVSSRYCDSSRSVFDIWKHLGITEWAEFISSPVVFEGTDPTKYYNQELSRFVQILTRFTKTNVTDKNLYESMKKLQRKRRLLKSMAEMQALKGYLTSEEYAAIILCGAIENVDSFCEKLEYTLELLDKEKAKDNLKGTTDFVKVIVSGINADNLEIFRILDRCRVRVIGDDLETASRDFYTEIDSTRAIDPLKKLSSFYFNKIPSPSKYPSDIRFDWLLKRFRSARADGMILFSMKYCDPWAFELPFIVNKLKMEKIPYLPVEIDFRLSVAAQIVNRIEPFIESLTGDLIYG